MYVKDVLFSETSTPKHFSAEVILDKKAIFRFMKDWLESFEDLSKDTVFSIGNLDFEPDLLNDMFYTPDLIGEDELEEAVKQMQNDWDFVIGDKLFVEGGGSYVSFEKAEQEMIEGINEDTLLDVPDSILLNIAFYLEEIKPEVQEAVLQRAKRLEKEQNFER